MAQPGEAGGDWTDQENDLIVADYFSMLAADLAGEPFSKTEHRRALSQLLPARNDKSIEFKHMNISAVMLGFGQPRVSGYPPAPNFQLSLIDAVARWLARRPEWGEPDRRAAEVAAVREVSPLWIRTPPTLANEPSPVDPKFLAAISSMPRSSSEAVPGSTVEKRLKQCWAPFLGECHLAERMDQSFSLTKRVCDVITLL